MLNLGYVVYPQDIPTKKYVDGLASLYCTCDTAQATATKSALLAGPSKNIDLTTLTSFVGLKVSVKFTYTNSANNPVLEVGYGGSAPIISAAIKTHGTFAPSIYMWASNAICNFVYDGTYWLMENQPAGPVVWGITKLSESLTTNTPAFAASQTLAYQLNQKMPVQRNITLSSTGWSNNTQIVTVTGVTTTNTIFVSPAPTSQDDYTKAKIICTTQSTDSLTFTCSTTPTTNISVNCVIMGVQ